MDKIPEMSSDDNDQIESAIALIKRRLKAQGAPEMKIHSDNHIDYRLCMIYYGILEKTRDREKAIKAVKDFAKSVTYDPNSPMLQPIF